MIVEIAENLVGQIIRFCKSSQLIANSSRGQLRYRIRASLGAIERSTHLPLGVAGPCRQRRVRIDLMAYSARSLASTRQGAQQEGSADPSVISPGSGLGTKLSTKRCRLTGCRSGESTTLCNRFERLCWHLRRIGDLDPKGHDYAWHPLIRGG